MDQNLYQIFLLCFSLASASVIWITHLFLKQELHEKHDKGYLYMAIAFLTWGIMALIELWQASAVEVDDDKARIFCSAINNALLIMSFSFIDHGWKKLSELIQKLGFLWIAVLFLLVDLGVGALDGEKGHWFARVNALFSIAVLILLFSGFTATFPKRKMPLMTIFSGITAALFVFTQLYVLHDKEHLQINWLEPVKTSGVGDLIRLLTRPMLLACILSLALTFLAVNLRSNPIKSEEETKTKEGEGVNNQLGKLESDIRKAFNEKYRMSDDDWYILEKIAKGSQMSEIAAADRFKKRYKDGDALQKGVIRRLANSFGLNTEKAIVVVLFAVREGAIDLKKLPLRN